MRLTHAASQLLVCLVTASKHLDWGSPSFVSVGRCASWQPQRIIMGSVATVRATCACSSSTLPLLYMYLWYVIVVLRAGVWSWWSWCGWSSRPHRTHHHYTSMVIETLGVGSYETGHESGANGVALKARELGLSYTRKLVVVVVDTIYRLWLMRVSGCRGLKD